MGRASGATALLAFAGLWTLCCVFAFGRFLGGEQPLDPRSHRARPDASENTAQHLGSSGRLASGTRHGAGALQEVDAFTGHDAFAERRHGGGGGGAAGAAFPESRESRRVPSPYGARRLRREGAMRARRPRAFDASRRSAESSQNPPGGSAGAKCDSRKGSRKDRERREEAAAMESAPAFEAGELSTRARWTTPTPRTRAPPDGDRGAGHKRHSGARAESRGEGGRAGDGDDGAASRAAQERGAGEVRRAPGRARRKNMYCTSIKYVVR